MNAFLRSDRRRGFSILMLVVVLIIVAILGMIAMRDDQDGAASQLNNVAETTALLIWEGLERSSRGLAALHAEPIEPPSGGEPGFGTYDHDNDPTTPEWSFVQKVVSDYRGDTTVLYLNGGWVLLYVVGANDDVPVCVGLRVTNEGATRDDQWCES